MPALPGDTDPRAIARMNPEPGATRLSLPATHPPKVKTMKTHTLILSTAALLFATANTQAQTAVKDPWVRGTVAQQKATGMFAQITSPAGGKLVSASSPVAGVVEIHEMSMEGSVMKMRAIPGLDLPAGKAVDLKPGGYHVMLLDLKQELKAGDTVAVTLVIEGADKKRETVEVKAPVRALGGDMSGHKH
jgi:periplasmic copper chaperone A